jgi:hypothetical protein
LGKIIYLILKDVSFLSQYKEQYLDRIIIALPMNIICVFLIISILKYFDFSLLMKFKLDKFLLTERVTSHNSTQQLQQDHLQSHPTYKKSQVVYNSFVIASFLNFLVNFVIVIFMAFPHINNRVMSTCPIFYIYCGEEIAKFASIKKLYKKGFFILSFFITYSILSCIFHPGSYVFT